jgi:hypothetical protein
LCPAVYIDRRASGFGFQTFSLWVLAIYFDSFYYCNNIQLYKYHVGRCPLSQLCSVYKAFRELDLLPSSGD